MEPDTAAVLVMRCRRSNLQFRDFPPVYFHRPSFTILVGPAIHDMRYTPPPFFIIKIPYTLHRHDIRQMSQRFPDWVAKRVPI
jgi:hypothetical protein